MSILIQDSKTSRLKWTPKARMYVDMQERDLRLIKPVDKPAIDFFIWIIYKDIVETMEKWEDVIFVESSNGDWTIWLFRNLVKWYDNVEFLKKNQWWLLYSTQNSLIERARQVLNPLSESHIGVCWVQANRCVTVTSASLIKNWFESNILTRLALNNFWNLLDINKANFILNESEVDQIDWLSNVYDFNGHDEFYEQLVEVASL